MPTFFAPRQKHLLKNRLIQDMNERVLNYFAQKTLRDDDDDERNAPVKQNEKSIRKAWQNIQIVVHTISRRIKTWEKKERNFSHLNNQNACNRSSRPKNTPKTHGNMRYKKFIVNKPEFICKTMRKKPINSNYIAWRPNWWNFMNDNLCLCWWPTDDRMSKFMPDNHKWKLKSCFIIIHRRTEWTNVRLSDWQSLHRSFVRSFHYISVLSSVLLRSLFNLNRGRGKQKRE